MLTLIYNSLSNDIIVLVLYEKNEKYQFTNKYLNLYNQLVSDVKTYKDSYLLPSSSTVNYDLKKALDEYENFVDKYVAFMDNYTSIDDVTELTYEYMEIMVEYEKCMQTVNEITTICPVENMTAADYQYYYEVITRCEEKLSKY